MLEELDNLYESACDARGAFLRVAHMVEFELPERGLPPELVDFLNSKPIDYTVQHTHIPGENGGFYRFALTIQL